MKEAQVALVGEDMAEEINATDDLPEEFDKLTAKQQTFVMEYALSRNGTEAARKAGYSGDDAGLAQQAYQVLRNIDVQNAIRAYLMPHFERYHVTADAQVRELADIAYSPWRDHVTIRFTQDMKMEVKMQLNNKLAALVELNKLMGLYPKDDDGGELKPSINLHFHKHMNAEDARQALLDYLRKRG